MKPGSPYPYNLPDWFILNGEEAEEGGGKVRRVSIARRCDPDQNSELMRHILKKIMKASRSSEHPILVTFCSILRYCATSTYDFQCVVFCILGSAYVETSTAHDTI